MIIPKGTLVAIGGAEDKGTAPEYNYLQKNNLHFFELGILRRIVDELGGPDAHIEVITTASIIPEEVGENYLQAFGKIGCTNVQLMDIRNREDTKDPEYMERILAADGVLFSGGNQLRLTTIFGGTPLLRTITERYYKENFLVAGTSAGAMAMSNPMIYLGNTSEAHLKGAVKITTGFGFIQGVVIDSHFERRGRFGRLAQHISGLTGIVTAPLVHGGLEHLFGNSIPLISLGAALVYFYQQISAKVFAFIYLVHGSLVWLLARPHFHLGASGLVYGLMAFLLVSGLMRKNFRLLALSMIITFFYGSMIWGVLPGEEGISWEAHLFGALSGAGAAWLFRRSGPADEVRPDEPDTDDPREYYGIGDYIEIRVNKEDN